MFGQAHCRGISVLLSFKTRLPFDVLPEWKEVRSLPLDEQARAAARPGACGPRSVDAAHHGDYGRAIGAEARKPDYRWIRVLDRPVPPNPTVAERAAERGVDPVELMIDLALEIELRAVLRAAHRQPRPGPPAGHHAPPPHGDDVLRLRRARQPDHGLLDPDPPARPLGARPAGVHAGGGGAHDHQPPGHGLGLRRPRPGARGLRGRPQRVRPRTRRAGHADGRQRPARRRQTVDSSVRWASRPRWSAGRYSWTTANIPGRIPGGCCGVRWPAAEGPTATGGAAGERRW